MIIFYLLPIDVIGTLPNITRGPKYFDWGAKYNHPGISGVHWSLMDYGFIPYALLLAHNILQSDHDTLILNADVFDFPENIDLPVTDPTINTFFEGINIPADWLTPSTTYRELIRQTAGMFQFNQRYHGIAVSETGQHHSIFDNATLESRLRDMTAQEQSWFLSAVQSFGYNPALVNTNSKLRQLVKQAGDFWASKTFTMGGYEF